MKPPVSAPQATHGHDDDRYPVKKTEAQWREQLGPLLTQLISP